MKYHFENLTLVIVKVKVITYSERPCNISVDLYTYRRFEYI